MALGLTDEEYNAQGSVYYPPRPRSTAQHIAFWEGVRIPDELLANAETSYSTARAEAITRELERLSDERQKENPAPSDRMVGTSPIVYDGRKLRAKDIPGADIDWENDGRTFWDEQEKRLEAEWPIPSRFAWRTIVRAHHMWEDAVDGMAPEQQREVGEHHLQWNGNGTAPVSWIYERYRTWHIRQAMRTPLR